MFAHVEPFAGDPILALVEVFNADPRSNKVNLSIGIYFDELPADRRCGQLPPGGAAVALRGQP
jgi:aspartate/tyrosine/aromatic aminotransferase